MKSDTEKIIERLYPEQPETECVYCHGHINAGTYPPLCSDYCRYWFDVECNFNRTAGEINNETRNRVNEA